MDRVSKITFQPGECIYSYDVTALFLSVPVDQALDVTKNLLEQGNTLLDRSVLLVQNIIELLLFCLYNLFFFSKYSLNRWRVWLWDLQLVQLYLTCIWKILKRRHLALLPHLPDFGLKYVDDTFLI